MQDELSKEDLEFLKEFEQQFFSRRREVADAQKGEEGAAIPTRSETGDKETAWISRA